MIVRCSNCNSAFAVDDDKVKNKKFAFTCPKCDTENIFDNKQNDESSDNQELQSNAFEENILPDSTESDILIGADEITGDISNENDTPELSFDDIENTDIFADTPDLSEIASDDTLSMLDDDSTSDSDIPDLDLPEIFDDEAETPTDEREDDQILPDIDLTEQTPDESSDVPDLDLPDIFDDEAKIPTGETEDDHILADLDLTEEIPDESSDIPDLDLPEIFDDEADTSTEKNSQSEIIDSDDELIFNDELITEKKGLLDDSDMPDIFNESADEGTDNEDDRETKLNDQSEIDQMFRDREDETDKDDISFDLDDDLPEIVLGEETEETGENEDLIESPSKGLSLTIEEDNDDIFSESEESSSMLLDISDETASIISDEPVEIDDESTTLNLDELDIDLEDSEGIDSSKAEEDTGLSADDGDESTTLNLDELDIDIEETGDIPGNESVENKTGEITDEDESITIDLNELDIQLDQTDDLDNIDKTVGTASEDDNTTLDLNQLDIDLEDPSEMEVLKDTDSGLTLDEIETEEIAGDSLNEDEGDDRISIFDEEDEDESITIDLDTLDIDIAQTDSDKTGKKTDKFSGKDDDIDISMDFEDIDISENNDDLALDLDFEDYTDNQENEEDESITIDLDTLDIDIDSKTALDVSDDDEKLTLDDAGLTFDELDNTINNSIEEIPVRDTDTVDEDIKLNINDIDPDLELEQINDSITYEEESIADTVNELPEIDLEEFDSMSDSDDNDIIDLGDDEGELEIDLNIDDEFEDEDTGIATSMADTRGSVISSDDDLIDFDENKSISDTSHGSVDFSIDLSLKYSRLGAILRLFGLYFISMIPHLIVALIYTVLSYILGFINQIVILSTGKCVEDFTQIIENTLRYYLYIETSIIGIVEDRPIYTGKEDLNHQMQLNVTYPMKFSRVMAFLRLTVAGMAVIMLPHLILILLMALTIPFVYIAGILIVIFTERWPGTFFNYLTRYFRYLSKISAFTVGVSDKYPGFKI